MSAFGIEQSIVNCVGGWTMVWKAAIVFVASGLTGSGIVALSRSGDASAPTAPPSQSTTSIAATTVAFDPANQAFQTNQAFQNEALQRGYSQANVAAQRPFATFNRVTR
jgi:hypothetical protein